MSKREQARQRAARFATLATEVPAEDTPTETSTDAAGSTWDQAVAALEAADAEEFLSEPYMTKSEEAAVLFEQAAKELAETDPERSAMAADITARLRQFLALDWGDPAQVETSNDEVTADMNPSLVASGAPVAPPLDWFKNPGLTGPTPLTVTDEGHVYGHIALWNTCHTGRQAHDGGCTKPPRSRTGYAHFLTGALRTDDGTEVSVGHLTIDTRHANERLNAVRAQAHYDHTGHTVADVNVGEDKYGIWFSGALRPDLSDKTVRAFRSAPLSGDWRRIGGNLELVAALGVNMPGFPVPRPQGLVASGVIQSLVASGMVSPMLDEKGEEVTAESETLTSADLAYLRRMATQARSDEAKRLAREVRSEQVKQFARDRKKG